MTYTTLLFSGIFKMFPTATYLVIIHIFVTAAKSETVLAHYTNHLSDGFSKLRHNAHHNLVNVGYNAHSSLNQIHDNTQENFSKLQYKTTNGFSEIRDWSLPYQFKDRQTGLSALGNVLTQIRRQLRSPNLRQVIGDYLNRPGVARVLFLGSTGGAITAGLLSLVNINDRLTTNTKSIRDTCNRLKEVLAISNPQSTTGNPAPLAPTPSPNPVSAPLGDRTPGATPGYPIVFPLAKSAAAVSLVTGATDGLAFPTTMSAEIGSSPALTALSITDFNIFRTNVIQAIDILDQKIRDILAVTEPTCP